MSSSQDAAAEQAMSGAVNKMMAAATTPKAKPTQTAVTISVDAPDRKSLSRSQLGASTGRRRSSPARSASLSSTSRPSNRTRRQRRRSRPSLRSPRSAVGRPRLGGGSVARTVRASADEWAEWQALAEADGVPLNKWLRRTINDGAGARAHARRDGVARARSPRDATR